MVLPAEFGKKRSDAGGDGRLPDTALAQHAHLVGAAQDVADRCLVLGLLLLRERRARLDQAEGKQPQDAPPAAVRRAPEQLEAGRARPAAGARRAAAQRRPAERVRPRDPAAGAEPQVAARVGVAQAQTLADAAGWVAAEASGGGGDLWDAGPGGYAAGCWAGRAADGPAGIRRARSCAPQCQPIDRRMWPIALTSRYRLPATAGCPSRVPRKPGRVPRGAVASSGASAGGITSKLGRR